MPATFLRGKNAHLTPNQPALPWLRLPHSRRTRALALLWLLALVGCPTGGQLLDVEDRDAVDQAVESFIKRHELVGVSLGIARFGRAVYLKGYGYADIENLVPIDHRQSLHRWASVSKPLTAILALRLQEQGVVDLDEPINALFPDPSWPSHYCTANPCKDGEIRPLPPQNKTLTLRMLLVHAGGIPHYQNGNRTLHPTYDEIRNPNINNGIGWAVHRYVLGEVLTAIPASPDAYSYSSYSFNLAGWVLEKKAKRSFADLVADELGLAGITPDNETIPRPHRVEGYRFEDGQHRRRGDLDVSWKAPGGGLTSTVTDLVNFCNGVYNDTFLLPETGDQLWKPSPFVQSMSVGFFLGSRNNNAYIQHGGQQEKTRAYLRLYADPHGYCFAVFSNSEHANVQALLDLVEDTLMRSRRRGPAFGSNLAPTMFALLVMVTVVLFVGVCLIVFRRRRDLAGGEYQIVP